MLPSFPTLLIWLVPLAVMGLILLQVALRRPSGRPGLIAQWQNLNSRQRMIVAVSMAGFVVLLVAGDHYTTAPHKDLLRQLFHVPADIGFSHFSTQKQMRLHYRAEGIFQFGDEEWKTYVSNLDNPQFWKPAPFSYGGASISLTNAADAFRWHALPYPQWAGSVTLRWGSNAMDPAQYVRLGRYLCAAILRSGAPNDNSAIYTARACRNMQPESNSNVTAILLAVIDNETKTLYATIY